MPHRYPPRLKPGPLSPQDAYDLNEALTWLYRYLGGFTASAPLFLNEDSTGMNLSLADSLMANSFSLEDKLSDGSFDQTGVTLQSFYVNDFTLSSGGASAVNLFKRNLYCLDTGAASTQSIPNTTVTTLNWISPAPFDFTGFNVNATDFTFPVEGFYFARLQVRWEANATGNRQCQLLLNGNAQASNTAVAVTNGLEHVQECSLLWPSVAGGDTLKAQVYQDSGGALNVISTETAVPYLTTLAIYRVGGELG